MCIYQGRRPFNLNCVIIGKLMGCLQLFQFTLMNWIIIVFFITSLAYGFELVRCLGHLGVILNNHTSDTYLSLVAPHTFLECHKPHRLWVCIVGQY